MCSPEDVDTVMSKGLGLRYSFMGPFETMHLNAGGKSVNIDSSVHIINIIFTP